MTRRKARSPPSPAPGLTELERRVIVCFVKRGTKARMPRVIKTEMVKNALNSVLAAGGIARFGSCEKHLTSGDLLLSLVQLAAVSFSGMVPSMQRALMKLGINEFAFNKDRKRIKIIISKLPFSSLGHGSIWKPEDWQGDTAFDDLIRDLEITNPGFNVVGRPHWIGSLTGHKAHRHMQGSVVFTVELTNAVRASLDRYWIVVFSQENPLRVWV